MLSNKLHVQVSLGMQKEVCAFIVVEGKDANSVGNHVIEHKSRNTKGRRKMANTFLSDNIDGIVEDPKLWLICEFDWRHGGGHHNDRQIMAKLL